MSFVTLLMMCKVGTCTFMLVTGDQNTLEVLAVIFVVLQVYLNHFFAVLQPGL